MRSKTWVLSRSGRAVHTHAAAPETIGAEKLVPFARWNPDASSQVGTATGMSTPGAERSMARLALEKNADASSRSWLRR